MTRRIAGLCLLLLAPTVAWSADLPTPPSQQVLRRDPTGQWQLLVQVTVCSVETKTGTVTKKVPESKTVREVVDGKAIDRVVTQYRDVSETYSYSVVVPGYHTKGLSVDLDSIKAFETDGRRIPVDKLTSRVQGDTLVVVSATDGMLPESYASLFKPGTVILTSAAVQTRPATPLPPASVSPPAATDPPVAVPAPAAKLPELPKSPAPIIVTVSRDGADKLAIRRLSESTSPVSALRTFKKGNAKEMAPVQLMQTTRQIDTFVIPVDQFRFGIGASTDIPLDNIKDKLGREITVVFSADGDDIDPFWLRNLKSNTLVLVGPQLPTSYGSMTPGPLPPGPMAMPAIPRGAVPTGPAAPPVSPVPTPAPTPATKKI